MSSDAIAWTPVGRRLYDLHLEWWRNVWWRKPDDVEPQPWLKLNAGSKAFWVIAAYEYGYKRAGLTVEEALEDLQSKPCR